jgi:hypothetical protein
VKAKEERKALSRNVEVVKAVEWSPKWFNLVQACTRNLKDLAMNAKAREKSLMKKINVKLAMVKKSVKKRKF